MGHFPDSVKGPVLTRGFEESLIAVSKAFGWQAIWLRCARKIKCSVTRRVRKPIAWIFWKSDCYGL
jgi:hypothetical protein